MIGGVGMLVELVEYRNSIGIRTHVNAFGTCEDAGRVFSNAASLYLQNKKSLYAVELDPPIDCDTTYSDSWQVLRKLSVC